MELVNLTKRPLTLRTTDGEAVEIPPDPRHIGLAAMGEHRMVEDSAGRAFSLNIRRVRGVQAMPEPEEDTFFIVPVEVAMVLQERRDDVAFPGEDVHVRDRDGQVHRVTHLRRVLGMWDRRESSEAEPVPTAPPT